MSMWLEQKLNVEVQLPIVLMVMMQHLPPLLDEQDVRLLQAIPGRHCKLIIHNNAQPSYQQQRDQHKQCSIADSQEFFQIPITAIGEYEMFLYKNINMVAYIKISELFSVTIFALPNWELHPYTSVQ